MYLLLPQGTHHPYITVFYFSYYKNIFTSVKTREHRGYNRLDASPVPIALAVRKASWSDSEGRI